MASLPVLLCLLVLLATTCCSPQLVASKTHHSKRQVPQQQQQLQPSPMSGRENTNWWNLWWQQYINEAAQPTVRPIVGVHFNGQSIELDDSARRGDHSLGAREADFSQLDGNLAEDNERLRLMASMQQKQKLQSTVSNSITEPTSRQQSNWNSVRPTIIKPTQAMRDGREAEQPTRQPTSTGNENSFGIQMRTQNQVSQQQRQISMMDDSLARFEQQQQNQMLDYSEENDPEMDNNTSNSPLDGQAQRQPSRIDSSSSSMMQPDGPTTTSKALEMDGQKSEDPKRLATSAPVSANEIKQTVDTVTSSPFSQTQTTLPSRSRESQTPRYEQKVTTTSSAPMGSSLGAVNTDETPISMDGSTGERKQSGSDAKIATTPAGRVELENGRPATPMRPIGMRPAIRLPSIGPTKATTPQMESTSPVRGQQTNEDSNRPASGRADLPKGMSSEPTRNQPTTDQMNISADRASGGQTDTQRGPQMRTDPPKSRPSSGESTQPAQSSTEAPTTTTKPSNLMSTTKQQQQQQSTDSSISQKPASTIIPTTRTPTTSTMMTGTGSPVAGNETAAENDSTSNGGDDESGDDDSSDDQSSGNGNGNLMNSAGGSDGADSSDDADDAEDGDANDNEVQEPTTTPASSTSGGQQPTLGTIELERLPKMQGEPSKAQQPSKPAAMDKMQDRANLIMIPLDPNGPTSTSTLDGETAITVPMETLMRMMMMTRNQLQNLAVGDTTTPTPLVTTTGVPRSVTAQPTKASEMATVSSVTAGAETERESEQPVNSRAEQPKVSTQAPPTTSLSLSEGDISMAMRKKLQPPPSTKAPGARMQTPTGPASTAGEQQSSQTPSETSGSSGGPVSTVSDRDEATGEPKIELINLDLMPIQRIMQGSQTSPASDGMQVNQVSPITPANQMNKMNQINQMNQIKLMMMNNEVMNKVPSSKPTQMNMDMESAMITEVEPGMRLRPPNMLQPVSSGSGKATSMAPQATSSSTRSSQTPQMAQTQRTAPRPAVTNPSMVYMIMMNGGPTAHSKRPEPASPTASTASMMSTTSQNQQQQQQQQQRTSPPKPAFMDMMRQPVTSTTSASNKLTTSPITKSPSSTTPSKSTPVPTTITTPAARPSSQQPTDRTTGGRSGQQASMTTVSMTTSVSPTVVTSPKDAERKTPQRTTLTLQEQSTPASPTTTTSAPQTTTVSKVASSTTSIMTTTPAQTTTPTSGSSTEVSSTPKTSATSTAESPSTSTPDQTSSTQTSKQLQITSSTEPSSDKNNKLERLQQSTDRRPQQLPQLQQQVVGAKTLVIGKSGKAANLTSSFIPSKLRNDFNKLNTRLQQETQPQSAAAIRQFGGANRMSVLANQPVPFGRPVAMTMATANQRAGQMRNLVEQPTFDYGPSIVVRRPDEPLANGQMPNCTLSGKNFCVLAKDYPMNEVRQAVERSFRSVRIMYEELQTVSDQELHKDDFANQTNNQAASGKFACQTQVEMMRPGWAKDEITREWMLVVNTDVFPQKVRSESCAQPNTPCEFIAPFYDSTCQQRYSLHRMIAIDPHDPSRSPQVAVFRFPAGCVCRVHPIKKTTTMPLTTRMPTTIISSSTSKSIRRRRR